MFSLTCLDTKPPRLWAMKIKGRPGSCVILVSSIPNSSLATYAFTLRPQQLVKGGDRLCYVSLNAVSPHIGIISICK